MNVTFDVKCNWLSVVVLSACLGVSSVYGSEDMPCGSIPDPFPVERVGKATGSSEHRLRALSALPAKWDARDYGWVTSVKNQGSYGTCWAFAACSVLDDQAAGDCACAGRADRRRRGLL